MYEKFLNYFTDYIFVKDEPQKADVIFVPGNGYPQMAAHAAELWKEGFAPYVLPSGRYSTVLGHFAGVQDLAEQYGGNYETEWEFLRTVLQKNSVPEKAILREDQATYTYENALRSREVTDAAGIEVKKSDPLLPESPCETVYSVLPACLPGDRVFLSVLRILSSPEKTGIQRVNGSTRC